MSNRNTIPEGIHPLAAWRMKYRISTGELGTLIGLDGNEVLQLERNQYNPTDRQKERIHNLTGVCL